MISSETIEGTRRCSFINRLMLAAPGVHPTLGLWVIRCGFAAGFGDEWAEQLEQGREAELTDAGIAIAARMGHMGGYRGSASTPHCHAAYGQRKRRIDR